jgi:hypothetical protein
MPDQALPRMEALAGQLTVISERLEAVAGLARRTRRLAWALTVSFVLDIVLTILITFLTANALHQAASIHQSQLAACAISNQTRIEQIALWNYVVQLSSQNPDANKAQLAKFEAFVKKTFQPVNCARIYR